MAATMSRRPFAELSAARSQVLAGKKNCQNAITESLKIGLSEKSALIPTSGAKRSYPTFFEDNEEDRCSDAENVDPGKTNSKRSKTNDGAAKSKGVFGLKINTASPAGASLSTTVTPSAPLSTPTQASSLSSLYSLPSGAASAPAGRSPKHKRTGLLFSKRPGASPFRRIDPPGFNLGNKASASSSSLPFSIDSALHGTLSAGSSANVRPTKASTLEETMPKAWFFSIHEDTPQEEATNLMEHSASILDISSEDEAGPSKKKDDRGKENIPPPDSASEGSQIPLTEPTKRLRPIDKDAMVDVGEERSPLSSLPVDEYYSPGLDANSVEVSVNETDAGELVHAFDFKVPKTPMKENDTPINEASLLREVQKKASTADAPLTFTIAEDEPEPDQPI